MWPIASCALLPKLLDMVMVLGCRESTSWRRQGYRALVVSCAVIAPIDEPARIGEVAAAITRSPLVAFDLEFLAQDRLVPTLCLVQVAWLTEHDGLDASAGVNVAGPEVALLDPLAVDVRPVIEAL